MDEQGPEPGLKTTGRSGPGQKSAGQHIPTFRDNNPAGSRDGSAVLGFHGTQIPYSLRIQFDAFSDYFVILKYKKRGTVPCRPLPIPVYKRILTDDTFPTYIASIVSSYLL